MKKIEAIELIETRIATMKEHLLMCKISEKTLNNLIKRIKKDKVKADYIIELCKCIEKVFEIYHNELLPIWKRLPPIVWARYAIQEFDGRETKILAKARKNMNKMWQSQPKFSIKKDIIKKENNG